jgi:hypothetical protein
VLGEARMGVPRWADGIVGPWSVSGRTASVGHPVSDAEVAAVPIESHKWRGELNFIIATTQSSS